VGILVGSRYGDGQNFASFNIGTSPGENFGQGVYALNSNSVSDLTGFSGTGRPISQWGDRGDSANAGIEIAIPLSSLGLATGDYFKAAAIFCSTNNGTSRWLSREAYGESVTGTTANSSAFGYNTVTLIGSPVYLSPQEATPTNPPPPANDNDVILQGFYWNVSKPPQGYFSSMTVAGSFNSWNPGLNNMTLVGDDTWEYVHYFTNATGVAFKFVANGSWDPGFNWGENNQSDYTLPYSQQFAEYQSVSNIVITGTVNGVVLFRFNNGSQLYDVTTVATGTVPTFSPGYAGQRWYNQVREKAESNELSRFTMVWLPPPSKAHSGRYSAGYDPYDHFDLGKYNAKGTTATLYGTEAELQTLANALNARGIVPMVDLVLNHTAGGETTTNAGDSGTGRYNYQPTAHETFEKPDPAGNNSNGYFNVTTMGEPFSFDWEHGDPGQTADLNQENAHIRQGLKNWGAWASAKVGYRGYRWDFTQGMEPWFIPEFMNHSLMKGRFSVMEYWTKTRESTPREHSTWLALTDYASASFDFPLWSKLQDMCNLSGSFNMNGLSRACLVHAYPQWACTFVESHDTARAYGGDDLDKFGITRNKEMAYAYVLTAEGTPCVFGHDYFDQPYVSTNSPGWSGMNLMPQIDALIDVRRKFAGGTTSYLSTMNTNDLYIAKRNGTETKPGCIIVINDNMTTTLYDTGVNTGWASTNLVDALQTNVIVSTDGGGVVQSPGLSAPPRGYRVYVRQGDL
jgi:alpha-amylase